MNKNFELILRAEDEFACQRLKLHLTLTPRNWLAVKSEGEDFSAVLQRMEEVAGLHAIPSEPVTK
jgi:hypothetical protein